ncbi:MAG: hypothetical protein ABH884_01865, partial [Candidatus Komeilibacteria bacterium]
LQATNFEQIFADSNWLFHVLLVPFVGIFNIFLMIKFINVLLASLLITLLYFWLKRNKGKWPLFFVALLLTALPLVIKIGFFEPTALVLIFYLIGLDLMIHYRYWGLLIASIVFALLSGFFIILPIIAIVWIIIDLFYLQHRMDYFKSKWGGAKEVVLNKLGFHSNRRGKKWLILISTIGGILIGSIIHPYWPNNLIIYYQTLFSNLVNNTVGLNLLLINIGAITICVLLTLAIIIIRSRKASKLTILFSIISFLFLLLAIVSYYYLEFFIINLIILLSLLWRDLLYDLSWHDIWHKTIKDNQAYRLTMIVVIVIFVVISFNNIVIFKSTAKEYPRLTHLQGAAEWLRYHTPDSSLVVSDRWQDWASLFYYNDSNTYFLGKDKNYINIKHAQTADEYFDLMSGKITVNSYLILRDRIKADYLLISKGNLKLQDYISQNIYFELVYEDNEVWIYQLQ